jgi:RHS repeat-associated protein
VWDAWNREVKIKNSSNTVIATNAYDALNHKVQVTTSAGTIDEFFSNNWQVLEGKSGSNTQSRYVWSPAYVDGLVARDRDTDANGTLDERLFALQDANWNVTGITNTSGTIQERYTETPYGAVTFRDGSGSTISVSTKGWDILHHGAKTDIIGDYDFRNRVYSPTLGRWLTNDPIGFSAGDVNTFRYVGNGPTNKLDPLGLQDPKQPKTKIPGIFDLEDFYKIYNNPSSPPVDDSLVFGIFYRIGNPLKSIPEVPRIPVGPGFNFNLNPIIDGFRNNLVIGGSWSGEHGLLPPRFGWPKKDSPHAGFFFQVPIFDFEGNLGHFGGGITENGITTNGDITRKIPGSKNESGFTWRLYNPFENQKSTTVNAGLWYGLPNGNKISLDLGLTTNFGSKKFLKDYNISIGIIDGAKNRIGIDISDTTGVFQALIAGKLNF